MGSHNQDKLLKSSVDNIEAFPTQYRHLRTLCLTFRLTETTDESTIALQPLVPKGLQFCIPDIWTHCQIDRASPSPVRCNNQPPAQILNARAQQCSALCFSPQRRDHHGKERLVLGWSTVERDRQTDPGLQRPKAWTPRD